nr:zinc-binding dehydrogenase [Legionella jordanis]
MRCILIENPGPDSKLVLSQQDKPKCGDDELLVLVKATAVNRADLLQRQGKYPPPAGASLIPGLEIAGEVTEIGANVSRFKPGDAVYGLVAGGAYAEYCCVNQNLAEVIPPAWTYSEAAGLPEALMTAHATVFMLGQLNSGQTLLIHGAGSGIASLAIQMAKLRSASVISTAGTDEKISRAQSWGIQAINYKNEDFENILGPQSIDVVVDFIGGDYFSKHLNVLKPLGRLIQIACMKGYMAEANLLFLMQKRLQINGFVLRSQSLAEKKAIWKSAQQHWQTAILNKHILPIIDSEFDLSEIEQAHRRMKSSEHMGKIIVNIR